MGSKAALEAIKTAGISISDIDLIISTTCTSEYFYPSLSGLIQGTIGAKCPSFDVNNACSGFVYAFDIAHSFLVSGKYKTILLVSSEKLTNHANFSDRNTAILFGDGAGALILQASDGLYSSHLGADGDDISKSPLFCKADYQGRNPYKTDFTSDINPNEPFDNTPRLVMDGKTVYKFAVYSLTLSSNKALEKIGLTVDDVDLLIPHQANIRIIDSAINKLKIPREKVVVNIDRYANMSSACISIALAEMFPSLKASTIDSKPVNILMAGFGAGLAYGAVFFSFS